MPFLVRLLVWLCIVGYFEEICCSLVTSIEVDEPYLEAGIKGRVKDAKGYQCSYHEVRKGGGGPRHLQLYCKNNCGDNIECSYKGQPHDLSWYNKNQAKFYKMMADKLAKESGGMCSAPEVEIKGIVFQRQ